ncbi:MAG: terminase small subunit [Oscillospiraceae bacterium]|nr:terminase small subunit [Oscillospiraceae bacterium]
MPKTKSARRGLQRLAFGGVGDVLELLFLSENPGLEHLRGLDLFCVSELKRTDKGGLEIKFHDRLKALEVLLAHEIDNEAPGAVSLYKALAASARGGDPDEA